MSLFELGCETGGGRLLITVVSSLESHAWLQELCSPGVVPIPELTNSDQRPGPRVEKLFLRDQQPTLRTVRPLAG